MKKSNYILIGILIIALLGVAAIMGFDKSPIMGYETGNYTVKTKWKMPKALDEISGISWISNHTIACIQDEDGIIFIYDLDKKEIVQEIEFANDGDYEGIAIIKNNAYVMRSDGVIFEVSNFRDRNKSVSHFKTDFSEDNNMETLVYDQKSKCLITAPKDKDLESEDFKGLYHIPIASKSMEAHPFIKIDMGDEALSPFQKKKAYKTFNPSDIAIHPKTGDYYVLEGKKPKLLILNTNGNVKSVYELDEDNFPQPEGLTFDPNGLLYISNEVDHETATILQVDFN